MPVRHTGRMSRSQRRSVAGVATIVAAALVGGGLVAGGIALTAERGTDDAVLGGGATAQPPTGVAGAGGSSSAADGTVVIARRGPDLPGAAVLDRCDTSSRAEVAQYDTAALGPVVLQCGTSSQGYEHIRVRHDRDWTDVVSGHGSRDWDDAVLTALQTVLTEPRAGYPQDAGDGKVCYAAPVAFDDGSRPAREPFVKVIVSATTDRVITAYPTDSDGC